MKGKFQAKVKYLWRLLVSLKNASKCFSRSDPTYSYSTTVLLSLHFKLKEIRKMSLHALFFYMKHKYIEHSVTPFVFSNNQILWKSMLQETQQTNQKLLMLYI